MGLYRPKTRRQQEIAAFQTYTRLSSDFCEVVRRNDMEDDRNGIRSLFVQAVGMDVDETMFFDGFLNNLYIHVTVLRAFNL